MPSFEIIIAMFLFYAMPPIAGEGVNRLYFSYIPFSKVIEEWKLFAEFFNLEISSPNFAKFGWIKGFKLMASGFFQEHYFDCTWSKVKKDSIGEIICKIEIQNPSKLTFEIEKEKYLFKTGNIVFDNPYLKNNFTISSNNANGINLFLDDIMMSKIKKIFSRNLKSKLSIEKKEVNSAGKDLLLDETDTYFLVYTNSSYPFQNKAERLFIQDNLLIMIEIARKIDGLKEG